MKTHLLAGEISPESTHTHTVTRKTCFPIANHFLDCTMRNKIPFAFYALVRYYLKQQRLFT